MSVQKQFARGRFVVEQVLGRGNLGIVYKALDKHREMKVALKTLRFQDPDKLYYFKREFRSLQDLVHPNVCGFMDLIQDDDVWFLTMELIEGEDFLSYVRGESEELLFDEHLLRRSLSGLCQGLNALHVTGKVHRDVKPSNVMVTQEGRVVLLDFGLVTREQTIRQTETDQIVGTAAYMAPEQAATDSVGSEADWYSVGVILYETLTGKLPFEGAPLDIILKKQAIVPIRPRDLVKELPSDLEQLCMDLLHKDPAERPGGTDVLSIVIGPKTVNTLSHTTNITARQDTEIFIGRKRELQLLDEAYQEAGKGSFVPVVIEGVSGVGKSSLIANFLSEIKAREAKPLFLRGRCYEQEFSPFKAFDGIVESIIRYLRYTPEENSRALIPHHVDLLLRLFPSLRRSKSFFNLQYSMTETDDAQEVQKLSFAAFKELLFGIIGQNSVVVVIDDMQWADADSISLLKTLLEDGERPPMLLILMSRFATEAGDSVWDWDTVATQKHRRIQLKALNSRESTELARTVADRAGAVSGIDPEMIASESEGHPHYIAELVHHIASFEGEKWSRQRLDDVIWNRVDALPTKTKQVLQTVCIAGTPIERTQLKILMNLNGEDFHQSISSLKSCHLIRTRGPKKNDFVEPYHNRVREAVTTHLSEENKLLDFHLKIGRFLLKSYSPATLHENVFHVTHHLNAGKRLISSEGEMYQLCLLNLKAGNKAKKASAYGTALDYFMKSIDQLPTDEKGLIDQEGWRKNYDLSLELHSKVAEMAFLLGKPVLMALHCDTVVKNAASVTDRVNVYETMIQDAQSQGDLRKAVSLSLDILMDLGINIPRSPGKQKLVLELVKTRLLLANKSAEDILNLHRMTDPRVLGAVQISHRAGPSMFFVSKEIMAINILIRLRLSLTHGNAPASLSAYAGYALICCGILRNFEDGYKYGKIAVALLEKDGFKRYRGPTMFRFNGFIRHWKEPVTNSMGPLLEAYRDCVAVGDIDTAGYPLFMYSFNAFLCGRPMREFIPNIDACLDGLKKTGERFGHRITLGFRQAIENVIHADSAHGKLNGDFFDEDKWIPVYLEDNNVSGLFGVFSMKSIVDYYFGNYEEALLWVKRYREYLDGGTSIYLESVFYFYESLILIASWDKIDKKEQKAADKQIHSNIKLLKKFSKSCESNFANKLLLVKAELARKKRAFSSAAELYQRSIDVALQNGFFNEAALACERFAIFQFEENNQQFSRELTEKAIKYYGTWGADAKVVQLKSRTCQMR